MTALTTEMLTAWPVLAQTGAQPTGMPGWLVFLIVVLILGGPFVLGSLIARGLKLKDLGGKIGVVLFTIVLGLTPFVQQEVIEYFQMRHYRTTLAKWQDRADRNSNQIDRQAIENLQETLSGVRIRPPSERSTPDQSQE